MLTPSFSLLMIVLLPAISECPARWCWCNCNIFEDITKYSLTNEQDSLSNIFSSFTFQQILSCTLKLCFVPFSSFFFFCCITNWLTRYYRILRGALGLGSRGGPGGQWSKYWEIKNIWLQEFLIKRQRLNQRDLSQGITDDLNKEIHHSVLPFHDSQEWQSHYHSSGKSLNSLKFLSDIAVEKYLRIQWISLPVVGSFSHTMQPFFWRYLPFTLASKHTDAFLPY